MAHQLRVYSALPEYMSSVPRTFLRQHTTACNSSFRKSDASSILRNLYSPHKDTHIIIITIK